MATLNPQLWQRVRSVFDDVVERPPAERAAYLEQACGGDDALRHEIESLLAAYEEEGRTDPPCRSSSRSRPPDEAAWPTEGAAGQVGPYKLLERIGEGGFGSVFLAEQSEPVRRSVALKIIKLGMDTRQVVTRFEAERQALAMMDHPNIARVLDAGATESGRPYFVMELVKGVPITRYCDDHQVALPERLALFIDVCHAVQHAHQKGIIHRDLKPSNVLVSRHDDRPVVKVIDFGIAKATGVQLTDRTLHTEWRQLIGTPAYMSPEQAGLSDIDIDTRSDVYSLGVVLYELLTGTTPFEPERLRCAEFDELRRIIREEEPPRPSARISTLLSRSDSSADAALPADDSLAADDGRDARAADRGGSAAAISVARRVDPRSLVRSLHGEPDWIVMKCLEKDRTRRYATTSDLAQDVERYLRNEPVLAGPPSRLYRFRKFARRNRATVTAATLVAAALLAGMAGTTYGLLKAEERRAEAEAARLRERAQRELAEKREKQLQQVSEFQGAMLSSIDVNAMGRGIKEHFREPVRAALERQYVGDGADRRKRTPEEIEAEMAAFDRCADTAAAADVARGVMDEFVLARASDALEKQFADQPQVQAQLHAAIGNTYNNLGLYDAAEPHLRSALEIRTRELGAEHERVADSMSELGVLLLEKGDHTASEPLLHEALALRRKLLGHEHPAVATSMHNLAGLLAAKRDRAAAEQLYRDALAMRRKLLGNEHPDVVWTLKNLGNLLTGQHDYPAAEPLLREALTLARKLWGDQHPDTANCLSALAVLLEYKGDPAAESMYRDALASARKAYGYEHPYVAAALSNLAIVLTTKRDYAAAQPLFREALAIRRKVFGDEHPAVKSSLRMLVKELELQGEYAAAEPFCRELLDLARENPADRVNLAAALAQLGLLLVPQARYADAEPILRECLAIRENAYGPDSPDYWRLINVRSTLGGALAGQGASLMELDAPTAIAKFAEAEPLLVESSEWLTQNAERIPQDVRAKRLHDALERIVWLYESWDTVAPDSGKAEQAAEWRAKLQEPAPDKADGG